MKASKQLLEKGSRGRLNSSSSSNSRLQAALQERLLLMPGRSRMIGTICSYMWLPWHRNKVDSCSGAAASCHADVC